MKWIGITAAIGLSACALLDSGCAHRPSMPATHRSSATDALARELAGWWENFDFEHNSAFDQFRIQPDSTCEITWYVEYTAPGRMEALPERHFRLVSAEAKQKNRRYVVSEEFVYDGSSITRLKDGVVFQRRKAPMNP